MTGAIRSPSSAATAVPRASAKRARRRRASHGSSASPAGGASTGRSPTGRPTCHHPRAGCSGSRTRRCSTTSRALAQHGVNTRLADGARSRCIPRWASWPPGAQPLSSVALQPRKEVLPRPASSPTAVLGELGVEPGRILAVLRTAPSYALYLGGAESALRCLASCAGWSRTSARRRSCSPATTSSDAPCGSSGSSRCSSPSGRSTSRSLVAFALVSAGGTVNRGPPSSAHRSGRSSRADSAPSTSSWPARAGCGSSPTRRHQAGEEARGRVAGPGPPRSGPACPSGRSERGAVRFEAMVRRIEHEVTIDGPPRTCSPT